MVRVVGVVFWGFVSWGWGRHGAPGVGDGQHGAVVAGKHETRAAELNLRARRKHVTQSNDLITKRNEIIQGTPGAYTHDTTALESRQIETEGLTSTLSPAEAMRSPRASEGSSTRSSKEPQTLRMSLLSAWLWARAAREWGQ